MEFVPKHPPNIPSPASREREGPIAQQWEGEGTRQAKRLCLKPPLTRRALRARHPCVRKKGESMRAGGCSNNCPPLELLRAHEDILHPATRRVTPCNRASRADDAADLATARRLSDLAFE